ASPLTHSKGGAAGVPALLRRMPTPPHRPTTSPTNFSIWSALVTSTGSASTCPPALRMPSAARSSTSGRRAQMATRAPSAASLSAAAPPVPSLPPVMMATCAPSPTSSMRVSLQLRGLTGERLITNTMGLLGRGAQTLLAVGFVVLVVALEPFHAAVALEGEHVRGNPVEEPAVVADDDGTA